MTNNTIKDYNDAIEYIREMMEEASDTEYAMLENAVESIQRAESIAIDEKKEAIDMLYECGDVSEEDYRDYVEYLNENAFEAEKDLNPYMETASIGMALTLGESEKAAYRSKRCKNILAMETGDELSDKDISFLESRLDKYLRICEATEFTEMWKQDIDEGYMTEGVRDLLTEGEKMWKQQYVTFEHEAQDFVMQSINEKGGSDYITEQVQDAVDLGYITKPIADRMTKIISICDIKSTM